MLIIQNNKEDNIMTPKLLDHSPTSYLKKLLKLHGNTQLIAEGVYRIPTNTLTYEQAKALLLAKLDYLTENNLVTKVQQGYDYITFTMLSNNVFSKVCFSKVCGLEVFENLQK